MRTFLLLALTFVAVNATQPDRKDLILDNIIAAVKHVLCHEDEVRITNRSVGLAL